MTLLTDFYVSMRMVLGDIGDSQQYADTALRDAVRTAVRMGKLPTLTLTPALDGVTPDVTTPTDFARMVLHSSRLFVVNRPKTYAYRRRAVSESFGGWDGLLADMDMQLHNLENNSISGWQSYFGWLAGMSGLPLAQVMTEVSVQGPWYSVAVTGAGTSAATL